MKFFISVDMEGISGISSWKEVNKEKEEYVEFREILTKEVISVCNEINKNGNHEIVIRDGHWSAGNICLSELPENVQIIRGWSGGPLMMMEGISDEYDAVLFIGYHSGSYMNGNVLAHTMDFDIFQKVKINGKLATEFLINSYIAAYYGVPVVYISGDEMICNEAKVMIENIKTTSNIQSIGGASISLSPNGSIKKSKINITEMFKLDFDLCKLKLPQKFEVEMEFKEQEVLHKMSYYPGVEKIDSQTLKYTTNNYMDFLIMFMFIF